MNLKFVVGYIAIILGLSSCTKDKTEELPCGGYETSQLKYSGLVRNIINTSCSGNVDCHGTPQSQTGGGDLTTYALVKEKIDNGSFNNRVFILKDMPQGSSLSECDYKIMKDWFDAGAPQ